MRQWAGPPFPRGQVWIINSQGNFGNLIASCPVCNMKVRSQMTSSRNPWDERETVETQRWLRKNHLVGNLHPYPVTTQAYLTMDLIGPWGPGCQRTISSRLTLLFLVLTEIVKIPSPWLGLMAAKWSFWPSQIITHSHDGLNELNGKRWRFVIALFAGSHSNNPLNWFVACYNDSNVLRAMSSFHFPLQGYGPPLPWNWYRIWPIGSSR
jgi:hypothetical protein